MSLADEGIEGLDGGILGQQFFEGVNTDHHDDSAIMGDSDTAVAPLAFQIEGFVLPEELLVSHDLFLELPSLDFLVDLFDAWLEHLVVHTLGAHSRNTHTHPPLEHQS